MAKFMSLPAEIRIMIFKFLLREDFQPTVCERPYRIPICNIPGKRSVSKMIQYEAYEAYLSENNIVLGDARSDCELLERIPSYLNTEKERPLHVTLVLDFNKTRLHMQQRRVFRLLGQRTKLDLTIVIRGLVHGDLLRCGDLALMHGFASATSTQADAVGTRCELHRCAHQSWSS